MPGTHRTEPYRRGDGTPVSGYTARNPERRKASAAVTITIAATVGFLTFSGSLPLTGAATGGSEGASADISINLNQAIATLNASDLHITQAFSSTKNCAETSTGDVQRFFFRHPCGNVAIEEMTALGRGSATRIAITWVTMSSNRLATQYKHEVDSYGTGNPPEPTGNPAFNGQCYASGQRGATVWVVQVQAVGYGSASMDREILRDAAPVKPSRDYLAKHCID